MRGRERVEKVRPIHHGQRAQTGHGGALLPLAVRPWRPRDHRNHRKWHLLLCQSLARPCTAGAQGAAHEGCEKEVAQEG